MPEPVALVGLDHHHRPRERPAYDLVVAALAGLLGQQLGVGQARDDAGLARRAGSRRRRPAGRRRRRGRPRRPRRSARSRPGAARARSRRARRRGGRSDLGAAHSRAGSGGVGHVREGVGTVHASRAWSAGQSRTKTLPTTRSTGDERVARHAVGLVARGTCATVESAEWPRLSPITKMWPSGTGPAVQSQLAVASGRRQATPVLGLDVVVLVERLAVDRDPALLVAALDHVALDADHPLHQVAALGVEPDLGHHLGDRVGRAGGRRRASEPAAGVLEDDDVAALAARRRTSRTSSGPGSGRCGPVRAPSTPTGCRTPGRRTP